MIRIQKLINKTSRIIQARLGSFVANALRVMRYKLIRIDSLEDVTRHPLGEIFDSKYNYDKTVNLQKSVDTNGDPIPWFTYAAISYLERLDLREMAIFEWGAGHSSLYFADKCKSLTSIEFKTEWYLYVQTLLKPNMTLHLAQSDNYISIIAELGERYDIVIVDGEINSRLDCAKEAVKYLKPGGIIILDNSDWLPNTTRYLRDQDFQQVDFVGPGPINPYFWCTSFYFSQNTRLRALDNQQPGHVPGGMGNLRD